MGWRVNERRPGAKAMSLIKDIAYTKISLAELEALRAEVERLTEVLKPFDDLCRELSRAHLNGGSDNEEVCVPIGLLRAVSAALEPKP
jgi:prefoldin subunit 5